MCEHADSFGKVRGKGPTIFFAGPLDWLNDVTLEDLTRKISNLRGYVDLAKIVVLRAVDSESLRQDSQLRAMAGELGGRQLMHGLKGFYLSPAPQGFMVQPAFLARRLPDFLVETAWPYPYELHVPDFMESALDLAGGCLCGPMRVGASGHQSSKSS